jgi:hypothetical protein
LAPLQHAPSRFFKIAAVSRFLVRHPKISRFIAEHIPVLCPFLPMPAVATVPHVAPQYNVRARSLKPPAP